MNCKNCGSSLEFLPSYIHENYETNAEVVNDVHRCPKCNFLRYMEGKNKIFEFNFNFEEKEVKMLVTDYDVAISKMKEKEYAEEV